MAKQQATATRLIGPLRIESLANGGAGIARTNGQVVFVPKTAPGDLVLCRVIKAKKKYLEAELLELLEPSSLRRRPPCPVAAECGGCQWQHLPYVEQLQWKEKLFHETLIRQCGVEVSLLLPIVPSPCEWGYRSRAQVKCHFSGKRLITGFFRPKSRYVVGIDSCPLLADGLNQLLTVLRQVLETSTFATQISQIDLAAGDNGDRLAVVHYHGGDRRKLAALLNPVADTHRFDLMLQYGRKDSLQALRGDGCLTIHVDQPELQLSYAAGGFAQINLAQNRQLVAAVLSAAKLSGNERVLDLYCGMGNFSLPLARQAAAVCGLEDYPPSIEMAKRNAVQNRIRNVEFYRCPADEFSQYGNADLLLLDPPRSGASVVTSKLVAKPVPRILYVSCDPQTLARDLKLLLQNGYTLVSSQPYDMFPHNHHVESLTVLEYLPEK